MTEQLSTVPRTRPLSLLSRWLLSLQILLMMAYPVLLLAIASLLSLGVIIAVFSEPSWAILVLLPVTGGLWGVYAMAILLFHTLIKPNPYYHADTPGLIVGTLSCLAVIGFGYDSLFIWLMFSLPILAAIELMWLHRHLQRYHN